MCRNWQVSKLLADMVNLNRDSTSVTSAGAGTLLSLQPSYSREHRNPGKTFYISRQIKLHPRSMLLFVAHSPKRLRLPAAPTQADAEIPIMTFHLEPRIARSFNKGISRRSSHHALSHISSTAQFGCKTYMTFCACSVDPSPFSLLSSWSPWPRIGIKMLSCCVIASQLMSLHSSAFEERTELKTHLDHSLNNLAN